MEKIKNKKGFTMVELLVAMAIIGLLIATAIWGIGLAQQSARNTQRRTAGSLLVAGFAEFYARFNVQPNTFTWAVATPTNITLTNGTHSYVIGGFTGIMEPAAATDVITQNTAPAVAANCTGYGANATNTRYILGVVPGASGGIKVCVCLEGASDGSANLSANPTTVFCP